ncbi:MAG: hypothetical protein CTY10_01205 [Methylotenera sp.]|nr:MAG: hypothetical protein CTY10_01205 [Methylotenera sp.]
MTEYGQFWPLITLCKAVAITGGWWIILGAIFKLKKYGEIGESAEHSPYALLTAMGVGVLLINVDTFMLDWLDTVFGDDAVTSLYSTPGANPFAFNTNFDTKLAEKWNSAMTIILSFLQFWGVFSFVRGVFIFHDTTLGRKNSGIVKGIFHCLGGVIAFHFSSFSFVILGFLEELNTLS